MAKGMFEDDAHLYDLIYATKDYAEEAKRIRSLLESEGVRQGASVLEAACGTGAYLEHLRQWYKVSGFDLSQQMIELARRKHRDVQYFVADMSEFGVAEPVDAVLCLFSSIGYVHGIERLKKTVQNFADALRPGGVLVVEPWLEPEALIEGHASMDTFETAELKVCRQVVVERRNRLAVLDFHFLVASRDGEVSHSTNLHELYLYKHQEYVEALEAAGLDTRFDEEGLIGRGLYVARK